MWKDENNDISNDPKRHFFRVHKGSYTNKEEAQKYAEIIKQKSLDEGLNVDVYLTEYECLHPCFPDPYRDAEDQIFCEDKLNELIKNHKESEEKAKKHEYDRREFYRKNMNENYENSKILVDENEKKQYDEIRKVLEEFEDLKNESEYLSKEEYKLQNNINLDNLNNKENEIVYKK